MSIKPGLDLANFDPSVKPQDDLYLHTNGKWIRDTEIPADQAIHADTSHLFEHIDCLPAHYINAFCLGRGHVLTSTDGSTELGGTAFVHGSHKLSFTAAVGDLSAQLVLQHIVRPSLELGDVVLFDCRVLHFGLANTSTNLDRPLLYVNYTSSWFHDPKNWNDRHSLFSQECQPLG